jgi:hypothetical protein
MMVQGAASSPTRQARAERTAIADARIASLLRDVEREQRDPTWAHETESSLRGVLEGLQGTIPDLAWDEIQCRTTRCTLDVRLPSREGFTKVTNTLSSLNDTPRATVRWKRDGSGFSISAVVARPGFSTEGAMIPHK